jgi:tetratricopeptide (TPR) repeat protein
MNDMQSIAQGIEVARQRHAAHYRSVLASADELYLRGDEGIVRGLALFETERANIETGQSWAAEHAVADDAAAILCLEYSYAGQCVLPFRLHPRERIEWLEASLAASRKLKRHDTEGDELNSLGSAYYYMGEIGRAIECYEQSLIIKREVGDRPGEGAALGNLGVAYQYLGEPRRAIECFEQHLAIARETLTRRGEGKALGNLGLAYEALGEPRRAIEFFDQRLVIALEIGDRVGEAHALNGMGKSYASLGETRRAIEYFERSLVIKREMKDSTSEGETLYNLGSAYLDLGETRRAITCFEQSLAITHETGNRSRESFVLRGLGDAYLKMGEPRRAAAFFEQWAAIAREIGDHRGEVCALSALQVVNTDLNETRTAEQAETNHYRALITRMRARWPEQTVTAKSLESLASIYLRKKREAELQDEGLIKLCHSLGLPEGLITGETMSLYLLPCLVQVYTDDEIRTRHAPPDDQRLVEWFGYRNFEEGRFLCELAAIRDGRRSLEGLDIIGFQRALAASFAHHLATGEGSFPAFGRATIPALARIDGADLFFGGNYGQGEYREQMERPIKNVLTLDPGVRAIHTIDQLLRLRANDPASLFRYTTISRHPFIAQALLDYLRLGGGQTDLNDRLAAELEKDGIYQSLEGDLTTITQAIIDEKRQRKQSGDSFDIVIYLDLFPPKLARDSAPLVLSNAYTLLRRGGALLLGFPLTENSEKHITMLELTQMAKPAGFVSGRSRVHLGTSNLAKPDLPVYAFFVKE